MVYDHTTRVPMLIKGPGIAPGTVFSSPSSMVDMAPTMLELAGGPEQQRQAMDGMSFASALLGKSPSTLKDSILVEYLSIRDEDTISTLDLQARSEYIDAYGYRVDAQNRPQFPWTALRRLQDPESGPNHHWHDGPNNTFSAIRIINTTANIDLLYAEFADVNNPLAWDFAPSQLNFFELYDVRNDYYMMNNIYATASAHVKEMLHARVQSVIKCRGVVECTAGLSNSGPIEL